MRWMLVAMVLAGCVSEKPIDELSYSERQALVEEILQRCEAQGVNRNSAEMQDCFHVEAEREVDRRRDAIETRQNIGLALAAGFGSYGEATAASSSRSRGVHCTSNSFGNMVSTDCY